MANFKKNGHIDPDLFDVFVKKELFRVYGAKYLTSGQLDHVHVAELS